MVKLTKYILLACIVLIQQACVKDLQDDINRQPEFLGTNSSTGNEKR